MRYYATLAVGACLLFVVGYGELHYYNAMNTAKRQTAALRSAEAAARSQQALLLQPVLNSPPTDNTFGAPYNVRIVCEERGSSRGRDGSRVRLDANNSAAPGDYYQKTCRGLPVPQKG